MDKDDLLIKKRFLDLKRIADNRTIPAFSDFLNSNELNLLYDMQTEIPRGMVRTFGGYEYAERQMAMFLPDAFFVESLIEASSYPIEVLEIKPLSKKFAEDLNHRDILGSLMNLGIERSLIGDILVSENQTYVFCHKRIAEYICDNLFRIRHTQVHVFQSELSNFKYEPRFEEIHGSVASIRLDSVLAAAFKKSRSIANAAITAGSVYVNSRLNQNPSYNVKEGDVISFRGNGKFIFESSGGQSKKGKTYITIKKFI